VHDQERARYINGIVESTDGGNNWRYLSHLCDDPSLGNEGPDEMDLVRLASGELLSVFRTGTSSGSHIHQVRSTDGGETWSRPRDLGSVGVSPQLLLLTNGVLVCTYGTRDVHVMASWDGTGREWSKQLLIHKGEGSGYTDLQVNSYQHAAQASVFRDSLAGASCLYLGKFSSGARPRLG